MNTTKWIADIDKVTALFRERFGSLSVDALNYKPSADVWSIAQNIEHLIVVNQTYYPMIEQVRNGTYKLPWTGKLGFLVNFFGNFLLKHVSPDRRKKIKTFPIWTPSQSRIEGDILGNFEKHQQELKQLINDSRDLLDNHTIISSPANKMIVYKLEKAFEIIITHERRHLEQATELLELIPRQ
jgi:hypothetical protein